MGRAAPFDVRMIALQLYRERRTESFERRVVCSALAWRQLRPGAGGASLDHALAFARLAEEARTMHDALEVLPSFVGMLLDICYHG